MKALVTGGAGFIGSHVVDALLASGNDVSVIDNFESGRLENLNHVKSEIQIIDADIRDQEALLRESRNVDWIFHLAALTSVPKSVSNAFLTHDVNTTGTLNVLLAARESDVARVIFSSSCAVYGDHHRPPLQESNLPEPKTPYASSKLSSEYTAMSFYHSYGLETVCLRYFNVYGPRQRADSEYAAVIPKFVKCYQEGRSPVIYGDGHQSRDFIHVYDVARANIYAAICPSKALESHRSFNIGTSSGTSLLQLLNTIEKCSGKYLKPKFYPSRIGDIRNSWSDSKLAEEFLNFSPSITLNKGISDLYQMN